MKTVSATLAALIMLSPLGAEAQTAPKPPGADAPAPAGGAGGEEKPGARGKAPGEGGARAGEPRPAAGGEGQPGEAPKAGATGAGEARPAGGQPGEKPGAQKPGEARPGEAKPGETRPGETKPGEARPKEGKPGEGKPGEARPGEARPGEAKPGEARPGAQGRPGGAARAAPHLEAAQRTRVVTTFRSLKIAPVHVDFSVRVGVAVPRTVVLHPVPTEIVSVVPEFEGFRYFVVPGEIVIVDPDSLDIVEVLAF